MIPDWLQQVIVDHVFTLLEQSGIAEKIRNKLDLDGTKRAFKRALGKAFEEFEKHYPERTASLFNIGFFEKEGASTLTQFLIRDGHPDPSELATNWAKSLTLTSERRTVLIREVEPVAADFLDYFAKALKAEAELKDINDSRVLEQLTT